MSAISALRGYRSQFLYSLHYILCSPTGFSVPLGSLKSLFENQGLRPAIEIEF